MKSVNCKSQFHNLQNDPYCIQVFQYWGFDKNIGIKNAIAKLRDEEKILFWLLEYFSMQTSGFSPQYSEHMIDCSNSRWLTWFPLIKMWGTNSLDPKSKLFVSSPYLISKSELSLEFRQLWIWSQSKSNSLAI